MKSKYRNLTGIVCNVCLVWLVGLTSAPAVGQDDIQQRFDAATQAIENDRLRSARSTLESLLAEHPNMQRVRLELARVDYLSYDYDEAERLAQQVLDDPNTPPGVQTTVLAFLAQIRADKQLMTKRHSMTPSFYIGTLYDTNVNFGPSRDIIDIGGIPFTVTPNSQETDDWAMVINPAIAHTYNPAKTFAAGENTGMFVWQSQANAYYRRYFSEDEFNFGVLTLRTGPAWIVPDHWQAGIGLQGDQIWLDDRSLAWFTSVNPNITWELNQDTALILDTFITQRHYSRNQDSGRDGWYKWATLSVDHFLNDNKVTINGGIGYSDFDADDNQFSYKGPEVFAGVGAEVWQDGSVYARARYKIYDFKGNQPVFGVPRDDDEYRLTVGFQYNFSTGMMRDWSLLGDWTYTDNQSDDVPIFEYDRHELNLGLSRSF
ncbi:MAG: porin family protein [Gammaproteobacteria bacterium]|nr:hypothetical protein [Chromatiales bacterium]MDP6674510.1 porin family protein [Gammaproteobacteria bacterium]